jgi:uncharacterized membrane protein
MKTTLIGGIIFLVPVAIVAALLGKIFQLTGKLAEPISKLIPIESVGGVALASIIAVVLILVIGFVAGLAAKSALGGRLFASLESKLYDLVPRYTFIKNMTADLAGNIDNLKALKPIMVKFDDYSQIAFEVSSSDEDWATIYLPGSPDPWSGSIVNVEKSRIEALEQDFATVIKNIRRVGIAAEQAPT